MIKDFHTSTTSAKPPGKGPFKLVENLQACLAAQSRACIPYMHLSAHRNRYERFDPPLELPVLRLPYEPWLIFWIGLLLDGRWDHDAAYDHRYCFRNGEDEYLLGMPARWMSSTDFRLSVARERLEVLSGQFSQSASVFRPHSRHHQAQCTSRLWSHVDSVTERTTEHGQVLYLIRWKACWTPRSCSDDIDWLGASLRTNQKSRCQRSSRLERTAEARTKIS